MPLTESHHIAEILGWEKGFLTSLITAITTGEKFAKPDPKLEQPTSTPTTLRLGEKIEEEQDSQQ